MVWRGPATHTADDASRRELWSSSVRLVVSLTLLALLVVPWLRDLPFGQTTRTGLLAWILVGLAVYWLYTGQGYRALLLLQLVLFSAAAALLTAKGLLVGVGVNRLSILRRTARVLVLIGAACAGINLGTMVLALLRRHAPRQDP
jgi:peptidoglycan/LPS O-acetylase OafA/YrhL